MYGAGGARGRGSIVITIAPFVAGSWSQLLAYFIKVNPGGGVQGKRWKLSRGLELVTHWYNLN